MKTQRFVTANWIATNFKEEEGRYIHTAIKCKKLCIVKNKNDSHVTLFNSPILYHSIKPNVPDG